MDAYTVLRRLGGKWTSSELNLLVKGLNTQASEHLSFPEYALLQGHYIEEQIDGVLPKDSEPYILTQETGVQNLPFVP